MATNPLHPIVGPEDYISPYSDINYSKGPKIIYGDVDVLTIVLNDSQGDSDDEWGTTEQIALRMIIDEAIATHKELFGWSGILGIKDKFQALLGFFANFESNNFINPELTVFTIGNTKLSDGLLSFGSGASYGPFGFIFSNGFTFQAGGSFFQGATMTAGGAISLALFYSNIYGADPHTTITLAPGVIYDFATGGLTCPTGANISAGSGTFSGSLIATDGQFTTVTVVDTVTLTGVQGLIIEDLVPSLATTLSSVLQFPTQVPNPEGNNFIRGYIYDQNNPANLEYLQIQASLVEVWLRTYGAVTAGAYDPKKVFYFTKSPGTGYAPTFEFNNALFDSSLTILAGVAGSTNNVFSIDGFADPNNSNHLTSTINFALSGVSYLTDLKVFFDETVSPSGRTLCSFGSPIGGFSGPSLFVFNDVAPNQSNVRIFSYDTGDSPHIFSQNAIYAGTGLSIGGLDGSGSPHFFGISAGGGNIDLHDTYTWVGLLLQETSDSPNVNVGYDLVLSNSGSLWILNNIPSLNNSVAGGSSMSLQVTNLGLTQYNSPGADTLVSFQLNWGGLLFNDYLGNAVVELNSYGFINRALDGLNNLFVRYSLTSSGLIIDREFSSVHYSMGLFAGDRSIGAFGNITSGLIFGDTTANIGSNFIIDGTKNAALYAVQGVTPYNYTKLNYNGLSQYSGDPISVINFSVDSSGVST